jgi:hypothetical protein
MLITKSSSPSRKYFFAANVVVALYVMFVLRAMHISSFPGNRDITYHLSEVVFRSNQPRWFFGYDFTDGLGNRELNRASFLNPFSLLRHYAGVANALWVSSSAFIAAALCIFSYLAARWKLEWGTGVFAGLFLAVWSIIPSNLRVITLQEFGGHGFQFVAISVLSILAALSVDVNLGFSTRRAIVGFVALTLMMLGAGGWQPLLIWGIAVLVIGFGFAQLVQKGLNQGFRSFGIWVSISVTALFISMFVAGSPLLALLSSARSRDGAYGGVGDSGESILILWQFSGANTGVRVVVLGGVGLGLLILRQSLTPRHVAWLVHALSVSIVVQLYAIAFTFFNEAGVEIGPRPIYLAEVVFVPLLALSAGLVASLVIAKTSQKVQTHLEIKIQAQTISAVMVMMLPVLLFGAWAVKNPTVASGGVSSSSQITIPFRLTTDATFAELDEPRVMVVDVGDEIKNGIFTPGDLFYSHQHRDRTTDAVLFSVKKHEITRWQHWLFETFGAASGQNSAIFGWTRQFSSEFAAVLEVSHVLSDRPIDDSSLSLLHRGDQGENYLYKHAGTSKPATQLTQVVEPNTNVATALAVSRMRDDPGFVATKNEISNKNPPKSANFLVTESEIKFQFEADGSSLKVLPIEFSHCHSVSLNTGDVSSVRLLPVNGRFLGVVFEGNVKGKISFMSVGPPSLICQLKDFWDTRSAG